MGGNADGHAGLLCLPVPRNQVDAVALVVAQWNETCEVPLVWGGRTWSTVDDFQRLREASLNMPDLLMLGLETELAMALTPDSTWEKYPRGFGEQALLPESDSEDEELAAAMRESADLAAATARSEENDARGRRLDD